MGRSKIVSAGFILLFGSNDSGWKFSSIIHRNLIYGIYGLLCCFVGISGLFITLGAPYLALIQCLLFLGFGMVLVIFAVLLGKRTPAGEEDQPEFLGLTGKFKKWSQKLGFGLATLGVFSLLIVVISSRWSDGVPLMGSDGDGIGELLVGKFLLGFELVSIILLGAILGVSSLVRAEEVELGDQ